MTACFREYGRSVLPWLSALLLACQAFDAGLLETRGRSAGDSGSNGGGNGGEGSSSGNGGNGSSSSNGGDGGSGSPPCGDGVVSPGEKCDVAIEDGPGACPTDCPEVAACVPRMRSGSDCQAECVPAASVCAGGDGCCPDGCSPDDDEDCPRHCGDGVVQEDEGETCDPGDGSGPACPTQADCDDGDPCTTDTLTGSAANCNPACTHTTITMLQAGDQCCPTGGNATTDGDCEPVCGNQVTEAGEECDGGASCDDDCKIIPTAEQQSCIDRFVESGPNGTCERCACLRCTQEMLDCRDDADDTRRMRCDALITCGLDNDCTGLACYCGTADILACGTGSANGPCIAEVEQAAGPSTNPLEINDRQRNPNYALGRANLLGACSVSECPEVCP